MKAQVAFVGPTDVAGHKATVVQLHVKAGHEGPLQPGDWIEVELEPANGEDPAAYFAPTDGGASE